MATANVNSSSPQQYNGRKSQVIKVSDIDSHYHVISVNAIANCLKVDINGKFFQNNAYKILYANGSYTIPYDSKVFVYGTGYNFSWVEINGSRVAGSSYSYEANYSGQYYFSKGTTVTIRKGGGNPHGDIRAQFHKAITLDGSPIVVK